MKRHQYGMLLGCVGLVALIYFAPKLGLAASVTSALVIVLMFGCCLLPLLMGLFFGRGAGCHHSASTNQSEKKAQSERDKKGPSCH